MFCARSLQVICLCFFAAEEGTIERGVCGRSDPLCPGVPVSDAGPQLSPLLHHYLLPAKVTFDRTGSIKIPRKPRCIGISTEREMSMIMPKLSTCVYKVSVIGSQGHMARLKIYSP